MSDVTALANSSATFGAIHILFVYSLTVIVTASSAFLASAAGTLHLQDKCYATGDSVTLGVSDRWRLVMGSLVLFLQ